MPQPQQYAKDKLLTNLSIAYKNEPGSFIADQVFPVIPVDADQGTYFEFDKSNTRIEYDKRAPGDPANEIDYGMSQLPFGPLEDHSLKKKITDHEVKHSTNPLNPFKTATRYLTEKSMLAKELDAFNKLYAASNGVTVSTSTDRWNDQDDSDPIGFLQTNYDNFKLEAMRSPNALVLGYETVRPLLNHPAVISLLPDNALRNAKLQQIAELIGVPRIIVGEAQRNSGVEGGANSMGYVWGKHAFFLYLDSSMELETVSATKTLEQTSGFELARWYDMDLSSTWVRINRYYEQKITCQSAVRKMLTVVD